MGDKTGIAWTDATRNPIRGCSRVSKGCENCYAEKIAGRFRGHGLPYEGLTHIHPNGIRRWNGQIKLVPERLEDPIRWQRARRIFVNSMSDLFHEGVPTEFIDKVFAVMAICGADRKRYFRRECDHEGFDCDRNGRSPKQQPIHTFQILTKRPERMRAYLSDPEVHERILDASQGLGWTWPGEVVETAGSPLRNVHIGVSVEDESTLPRIHELPKTPAALHFVSLEPLLSALPDFRHFAFVANSVRKIQAEYGMTDAETPKHLQPSVYPMGWVIVGGESGPGARSCDVAAIRSIVEQCRDAGVPCFVKQLGARPYLDAIEHESDMDVSNWFGGADVDWDDNWEAWKPRLRSKKGDDPSQWPEDLRVQEFPQ